MEHLRQIRERLRWLTRNRENDGITADLTAHTLFRFSLSTYNSVAELAAADLIQAIDPHSKLLCQTLAAGAVHDIRQADGLVIPVLTRLGEAEPFALTAVAELHFDDGALATPVQALMMQINPDCSSVRQGFTDRLTEADARSVIVALIDAGRFLQQLPEQELISRSAYMLLASSE